MEVRKSKFIYFIWRNQLEMYLCEWKHPKSLNAKSHNNLPQLIKIVSNIPYTSSWILPIIIRFLGRRSEMRILYGCIFKFFIITYVTWTTKRDLISEIWFSRKTCLKLDMCVEHVHLHSLLIPLPVFFTCLGSLPLIGPPMWC